MSASPFARRKAKKVGLSEGAEGDSTGQGEDEPVAFVKRPALKSKRGSSARVSFGVDFSAPDNSSATEVFKPKKPGLGRQALERSAQRRSGITVSLREDDSLLRPDEARPSYSKEYLAELKSSTPATPKSEQADQPSSGEIDVASKFGADLARYSGTGASAIPTDAQVREKKARRARLAKEEKYRRDSDTNSDDDRDAAAVADHLRETHDSDEDEFRTQHDKISLRDSASDKPSKYGETRLVRDDEDFMEDFDEFVDAGQVPIGRKAARHERDRQREQMREMIENAEGSAESEDSSDSDADARRKYDAAQTRRGLEGMQLREDRYEEEAKTPSKITPLPTLAGCRDKIRANVQSFEAELGRKLRQLEQVERDRKEIEESERNIQILLNETASRFRQLVASGVLKDHHVDQRLLTNGANGGGHDADDSPAAVATLGSRMEVDEEGDG